MFRFCCRLHKQHVEKNDACTRAGGSAIMWTSWPRTRRKWRDPPSAKRWERNQNHSSGLARIRIIYSVVLAACMATRETKAVECPPPDSMPGCPCYNFEDGLFLECAGSTEESLRSALSRVLNSAGPDGKLRVW